MTPADLTPEDLARLRAVAEAATPGPWTTKHDDAWKTDEVVGPDGEPVIGTEYDMARAGPNADHIAAFDPPTCLLLLSALDRGAAGEKDKRIAELEAEAETDDATMRLQAEQAVRLKDQVSDLTATVARLRAELAGARKLLEPLAKLAPGIPPSWPAACELMWNCEENGDYSATYYARGHGPGGPTIGDIRAAAAFLAGGSDA